MKKASGKSMRSVWEEIGKKTSQLQKQREEQNDGTLKKNAQTAAAAAAVVTAEELMKEDLKKSANAFKRILKKRKTVCEEKKIRK